MNMNKVKHSLLIIIFILTNTGYGDNRIILHLRHASDELQSSVINEFKQQSAPAGNNNLDNTTPVQVNNILTRNSIHKYLQPPLSGFFALYGGYSDISDIDGLISFPLRHTSTKVYLAVTPNIKLVRIKQHTVSHKEYLPKTPLKLYAFEKKEDDKKQPFWQVQEITAPQDNKIDPLTIVILSNPENLVVPLGDFIAVQNPQLILPEVFVVDSKGKEEAVLRSLNIRHYFEAIEVEKKRAGETAVQKMITNR